jgi:hypothetical protein
MEALKVTEKEANGLMLFLLADIQISEEIYK